MLERRLAVPDCWICMAPAAFGDEPSEAPAPPAVANGHVTFGTANDPYKITPQALAAWARVLLATPGSRFLFLRPEGGSPTFRANMTRHFIEAGVSPERVQFKVVRGGVRPAYAAMDIALDTFPVTGGTTTCDALWMGVPTVTLSGPALHERLSLSILSNAGLGDLAADDLDGYTRIAADLAADVPRLAALRQGMRQRIRAHPLGQPQKFAAAFYGTIARALTAG